MFKATVAHTPQRRRAIAAAYAAILTLVLGVALWAGTAALAPAAKAESPEAATSVVMDRADVLSSDEEAAVTKAIEKLESDQGLTMNVIFVKSFDGTDPSTWASQQYELNPSNNLYVLAIATEGKYGVRYGTSINSTWSKAVVDSALPSLKSHSWAQAAENAASTLDSQASSYSGTHTGTGSGSSTTTTTNQASAMDLILPIVLIVALVGAGIGATVMFSRRAKKRHALDTARKLEHAEKIDPRDTAALDALDDTVLDELARGELTSTDTSIRNAQNEVNLSLEEFGEERARPLVRALENSQRTIQRAFEQRARVDAGNLSRAERRSLLVDIISSCGQADKELDAQVAEFEKQRMVLMYAPEHVNKLTQRVVDVHARMDGSRRVLDSLRARYDAAALSSINANVDMATEHLTQAEQAVDRARPLVDAPAGQQGGLIDCIRRAELSIDQATTLLDEIDNADTRIQEAKDRIDDLVKEVTDELEELGNLAREAQAKGMNLDREEMDAVAEEAWAAVENAKETSSTNPLGAYKALVAADEKLDALLDATRTTSTEFSRALDLCDRAIAEADAQISATNSLISTRGAVVGAEPRTLLAQATQLLETARAQRATDARAAISSARSAREQAALAASRAEQDISTFERDNRPSGWGGDSFLAGMVVSSLLNNLGGHHHHYYGDDDWGGGGGGGWGDWGSWGGGGGGDFGGFGGGDGGSF